MEETGIANKMQHSIRSDINVYVNQSWSHGEGWKDPSTGKLSYTFMMDSNSLGGSNWWNLQTGQKGLTVIVNNNGTITVN